MKRRKPDIETVKMPENFAAVAERRFMPLLQHFHWMDYDLKTLLRSVYFQGIEDMINVITKHPEALDLTERTEYQI